MSETLTFVRQAMKTPKAVGAVLPTGPALARCIVDAAELGPDLTIAELGAGTGPITTLLADHVHHSDVFAFEPAAELAARLRLRVPTVAVYERLAQDLGDVLQERGHERVDRVVSGLPWAAWPESLQDDVLDSILPLMDPEGLFVTFAYVHGPYLPAGMRFRKRLERAFADVRRTEVVWNNVPPAFVYVGRGPQPR